MASLLLKGSITSANTILSYETHVKYMFREEGCEEAEYKTPFLGQIRRGIKNTLPPQADKRGAFILPHFLATPRFMNAETNILQLLRFTSIVGFVGMLRPHTFEQLRLDSFTLILRNGMAQKLSSTPAQFIHQVLDAWSMRSIWGYYIEFQSKTMKNARAHFPNLARPTTAYAPMCPTKALVDICRRGLVKDGFLRALKRKGKLQHYLMGIAGIEVKVAPYALRIGGRTWYISQGLDRQIVDYLGTWKSPDASARYYRESPQIVIRNLECFYKSLPDPFFT